MPPAKTATIIRVTAGPRPYSGQVLPTASVVEELKNAVPTLLRTDDHDAAGCPAKDRVGVEDRAPGGCDNHILEVGL